MFLGPVFGPLFCTFLTFLKKVDFGWCCPFLVISDFLSFRWHVRSRSCVELLLYVSWSFAPPACGLLSSHTIEINKDCLMFREHRATLIRNPLTTRNPAKNTVAWNCVVFCRLSTNACRNVKSKYSLNVSAVLCEFQFPNWCLKCFKTIQTKHKQYWVGFFVIP